ncbi:MAG: T9SS type A sorting domain-containing protein [Ignavibacteriales bacterium]|nr:T9SS type A sorting domain-containing protein [Ignavibacteriales bacterium]
MTKVLRLMVCFALLPTGLSAQKSVEAGYRLAHEVTPQSIGITSTAGAYQLIGGFDLDADGKKEFIFVTDPSISGGPGVNVTDGFSVYYMENTGNDSYALRWSFTTDSNRTQRSYPYVALEDMDNDGNPELFLSTPLEATSADPNPPRLHIFEWDPIAKNFPSTPSATWNYAVPNNFLYLPTKIEIVDVDGDGDKELVTISRRDDFGGIQSGRTLIVSNIGSSDIGGLIVFEREFMDSSSVLKGGAVYDMKVVDFDGDGKKEIWVFTWDMYSLAIYEATGANTYTLQADINQAKAPDDIGSRHSMQFADVNGDGKLEMYAFGLSGDGSPLTSIYYIGNVNNVASLTVDSVKTLGGSFINLESSASGDLDDDGKTDFVITPGFSERVVYHMEYKGSGLLNDFSNYDFAILYKDSTTIRDFRVPAIVNDLDGDGKKEILIPNLDVADSSYAMVVILEHDPPSSIERIQIAGPAHFHLFQNYPNPFNPATNIRFSLPTAGHASLRVYDELGRGLEKPVDQYLESGSYSVTVNMGNQPSGVYFYTLTSGSFVETKKMILIR